jgi:hypothetical protein
MILISHRGNISGPNKLLENSPDYILQAVSKYNVEIDVWYKESNFYLGHDEPQYLIDEEFLFINNLWCHAKNLDGLVKLLEFNVHCFWHQNDDVTLTSNNYIWTYPGKDISNSKAIAVMPELNKGWDISKAEGICSDYISNF